MGHTVRDNPSPFLFFQQLSPRVNPNLTRTEASVYEARMLTALIHLCFAQFWRDYTMDAFVTDTRVGEWQRHNTNKHCKIPLPASNFTLEVFLVVNQIYGCFFGKETCHHCQEMSKESWEKYVAGATLSFSIFSSVHGRWGRDTMLFGFHSCQKES